MNFPDLFRVYTHNHRHNAQRNLEGRTHYVDDATLRYHKSRILTSHVTDNGLLFAIVESYAVDPDNHKRAYRPVIFDVFGTVIERPDLNDGFRTGDQARREMWARLNKIDAKAHTLAAIANWKRRAISDAEEMRAKVKTL